MTTHRLVKPGGARIGKRLDTATVAPPTPLSNLGPVQALGSGCQRHILQRIWDIASHWDVPARTTWAPKFSFMDVQSAGGFNRKT
jgi:hypothetical protein